MIPSGLKNQIAVLPTTPGVYRFRDRHGIAVYIGKAVDLKKRVISHFRNYGESFSKEGLMLGETVQIDTVQTPTEADALLLEAALVKEEQPKFNQLLKDDKSYPFLKITAEPFPRLLVVRGRKADGSKYFGPYTSGYALKQAVAMLRRLFPMRTCNPLPKKVCLMYHIGQCKGPCVGEIGQASYQAIVKDLESFLNGKRDAVVRVLARRMKDYSKRHQFEKAKVLYDAIRSLSGLPFAKKGPSDSGQVLTQLQKALSLSRRPTRIEAFDISNIFGKESVGSMVVFKEGVPARAAYRRFRIRWTKGIDDYRAMGEVIHRRFKRMLEEKEAGPDLVVIDGGKGQLSFAKKELDALGLNDLPVISIAKQHEYIFSPARETPHVFPQNSPILQLIQRLRDEAHRFAITYHRRLHRKVAMISRLDEIPGVGPKTKARLLKVMGSIGKIRSASCEELVQKCHISQKVAMNIRQNLAQ